MVSWVIVVLGVGGCDLVLVLRSSLRFAAIAVLAEGEVEVITDQTDPVLGFVLGVGFGCLLTGLLNRG